MSSILVVLDSEKHDPLLMVESVAVHGIPNGHDEYYAEFVARLLNTTVYMWEKLAT